MRELIRSDIQEVQAAINAKASPKAIRTIIEKTCANALKHDPPIPLADLGALEAKYPEQIALGEWANESLTLMHNLIPALEALEAEALRVEGVKLRQRERAEAQRLAALETEKARKGRKPVEV